MRPEFGDDVGELAGRLVEIGIGEPGPAPRRRARHAGVAPASRAAEKTRLAHPQLAEGGGQFADPVAAELIGLVDGQPGPPVADDFTLLAQGAGEHGDLGAARGVVRDRRPVVDGLVVGMGVHEQQPGCLLRGHGDTLPTGQRVN